MRSFVLRPLAAAVLVALALPAGAVAAQQPESGPKVGATAPDFSLRGATRYGLLQDDVRLSDYKGNTVVLAFFFRARTKG